MKTFDAYDHEPDPLDDDFFGRHNDDVERSGRGDIPYADWMDEPPQPAGNPPQETTP